METLFRLQRCNQGHPLAPGRPKSLGQLSSVSSLQLFLVLDSRPENPSCYRCNDDTDDNDNSWPAVLGRRGRREYPQLNSCNLDFVFASAPGWPR
jgi:hypothetical protein